MLQAASAIRCGDESTDTEGIGSWVLMLETDAEKTEIRSRVRRHEEQPIGDDEKAATRARDPQTARRKHRKHRHQSIRSVPPQHGAAREVHLSSTYSQPAAGTQALPGTPAEPIRDPRDAGSAAATASAGQRLSSIVLLPVFELPRAGHHAFGSVRYVSSPSASNPHRRREAQNTKRTQQHLGSPPLRYPSPCP
ncbi:hypothetical protein EVG20_g8471 [Dentipellis fragilis]|uniref:Uncharacterized protein n=1 Tax=Dentipellis fragilis TaxID=205917 RepID=A0A4Y9Y6U5_9AGAM|nr:hypothetical protein EVG20_g8471 [Dentipellis fragilis]